MDILTHILPEGYYPPNIETPYLPFNGINEGSFAVYPRNQGFRMHQEMDGMVLQVAGDWSYADYTRLLQSWLFFGLLQNICVLFEKEFDLSKLVTFPNNGRPNITATPLSPSRWRETLASEFSSTVNSGESGVLLVRMRDFNDVLFLAQHHAALFDFENPQSAEESLDRALIILSVKYMIYHMVHMVLSKQYLSSLDLSVTKRRDLARQGQRIREQRLMCGDSHERQQPSAMVMKRHLEANGWCPVLAEDVLRRRSLAHVYSAAALVSHTTNFAMHDNCASSARCLAYNVDLGSFQPVHNTPNCPCKPLKPDMAQIYRILEQKQIPIAHLTRETQAHISMEIEPADPRTQYTAVSHVWADGLASADYNGLLCCQLERLFDCLLKMWIEWRSINRRKEGSIKKGASRRAAISKRLMRKFPEKRIAIWVDAICVPGLDRHDLARSELMKRRAIELMTPTYAGASHVLVLDRDIGEISEYKAERSTHDRYDDEPWYCTQVSKYEKVAPIDLSFILRYSPWMGRCWTLQEGALGQCVMFQCAGWTCPIPRELEGEIEPKDIQSLIENLLSRSTSMQADEDQILANLSLLSANELSQYSRSDRIKAFIATKATDFPLSMLLRRIEEAPQKPREEWWVPDLDSRASFHSIGKESGVATLCEKGVIIDACDTFWKTQERSFHMTDGLVSTADEGGMLPCSIRLTKCEGRVFWITHLGRPFWIVLDLDIRQFTEDFPRSKGLTLTLLLPRRSWKAPCLNSYGFIGRGLCLTRTCEAPIDINHPKHHQVWPSLYNCALSIGTRTSLSAKEFTDQSTIPVHELDTRAFLISSGIASWPRLQIVRSGKFLPAREPDHKTWVSMGVFFGIISAVLGLLLNLHGAAAGIFLLVFAAPIGVLLSFITWYSNNTLVDRGSRKREYKRWVNSFAIADEK